MLKRTDFECNELNVIYKLAEYQSHKRRYELMLANCHYRNGSEADMIAIRRNGCCDEFEVKCTRSDLLADRLKTTTLDNGVIKYKHHALINGDIEINYFWYVIKDGIGSVEDTPDFAGLITVSKRGHLTIVKAAKKLHPKKPSAEFKYQLARKMQYRYWDLIQRTEL